MPTYRTGTNAYAIQSFSHGNTGAIENVAGSVRTIGAVGIRDQTPRLLAERVLVIPEEAYDWQLGEEDVPGEAPTDLVIQDALHAHTADSLVLVQDHQLAIQDALHGHTAENLALTQVHELVIQDALHSHAAENLDLTQVHILAIADALHAHAADNLTLTEDSAVNLVIQDALHAHAADGLVLTQAHILAIADALHAHAADGLVLTQVHNLTIQDALHGHSVDNLTLTIPGGGPEPEQHYYSMRRRRGLTSIGSRRG